MKLKNLLMKIKNKALLHYNISSLEQFKAGIEAVKDTKIPIIFGFSEGEINYLGIKLIKKLNQIVKEENLRVFFNGDHIKNFNLAKKLIEIGFDCILYDNSELDFKENILRTKKLIGYKNKIKKEILVEGELGFIGGDSDVKIFEIKNKYFTDPIKAKEYLQKTGIDLLAISIGNIHGMPSKIRLNKKILKKPKLDFERLKEIKNNVNIPLVLHGGSGINNKDLLKAIDFGIKVIHINTEFRKIWKNEIKKKINYSNIPYKILTNVVEKLKRKIVYYQKLFWKIK